MARLWSGLFDEWAAAVVAASEEPAAAILRAPASEEEIEVLEARLGVRLPPSYRAFLAHSDGADAFPGWGLVRRGGAPDAPSGLHAAASVGWLRDLDRGLSGWLSEATPDEDADAWSHPSFDARIPERQYLAPDGTNDPIEIKGGHLAYALAISVDVDGYTTLLNPLVIDADGEWEAWDFGTKLPGAQRHVSFAALLEADTRHRTEQRTADATCREGVTGFVAVVGDPDRTVEERIAAAWSAFAAGARQELVPGLATIARDGRVDLGQRQASLRLLGYVRTPDAIAVLVDSVRETDPRLRALAIPPLAVSEDETAREAAIEVLADPSTPGFVIRSTYRPAGPVVWEAYRRSGNRALLAQLAYLGEAAAIDAVVAALKDPDLEVEASSWDPLSDHSGRDLVTYAYYLQDPRVADALVDVTERFPQLGASVAQALARMGAIDQAIPLLHEALLAGDPAGVAARTLGGLTDPRVGAILVEGLRVRPEQASLGALAWHPSAEAVAAIERVLHQPSLHYAGVDALELMRIPEAANALAARAAQGDALATRALARLRDPRCRNLLLHWLVDPSARIAFFGADGLRDLRDPTTSDALLRAAGHEDPDVAVTATHALVSMASPSAPAALDALAGHDDERARALAGRWAVQWARREDLGA